MIKHKSALFAIALLVLVVFTGCQNAPVIEINPLAALSNDNAVFISIPVAENEALLREILGQQAIGVDKNDIDKIVKQISCVYIAIPSDAKKGSNSFQDGLEFSNSFFNKYQIVAQGAFPKIIENAVFSKKNAWFKMQTEGDLKKQYYKHILGQEVAVVNKSLLYMSNDVSRMIKNQAEFNNVQIDTAALNWIKPDDSKAVRFYINDAEPFISGLFQGVISLAVNKVYGEVSKDNVSSNQDEYNTSITLEMKTQYAVRPAIIILNTFLKAKGKNANINQIDKTNLQVDNLYATADELLQLSFISGT